MKTEQYRIFFCVILIGNLFGKSISLILLCWVSVRFYQIFLLFTWDHLLLPAFMWNQSQSFRFKGVKAVARAAEFPLPSESRPEDEKPTSGFARLTAMRNNNNFVSHLIDIELVLPPRQLSVAGGELSNEVVSADKNKIRPHRQASMSTNFIIWEKLLCLSPHLCSYQPPSLCTVSQLVLLIFSQSFPQQNIQKKFHFFLTFQEASVWIMSL